MLNSSEIELLLCQWLTSHDEIGLAILFGSHAKGTSTVQSDVDFAIQLLHGRRMRKEDKLTYLDELTLLLNVTVDLVDLSTVGQPLLSQVLKYGKRLAGGSNEYAQLAIKNVNSAQDFMPYIERMLTERRRRWMANG